MIEERVINTSGIFLFLGEISNQLDDNSGIKSWGERSNFPTAHVV
jgi:hypothetical protein